MSFETIFRRAAGGADEIYTNSGPVACRMSGRSVNSSSRFVMSMLAICVGLPLSGCAMGSSGRELAVSDQGIKEYTDYLEERAHNERRRANDARKAPSKNCYAAETPTRKVPDSVFRAYDSAASKSTGGVWKREYGSGGGGGGGGEGPVLC